MIYALRYLVTLALLGLKISRLRRPPLLPLFDYDYNSSSFLFWVFLLLIFYLSLLGCVLYRAYLPKQPACSSHLILLPGHLA